MTRTALLVTHTGRRDMTAHARTVAEDLMRAGFTVRVVAGEDVDLALPGLVPVAGPEAAEGAELVVASAAAASCRGRPDPARPARARWLAITSARVAFWP